MIDTQDQQGKGPDTGGSAVDPALLPKLRSWHGEAVRGKAAWKPDAEEDERMVHGHQWTRDEITQLELEGRKDVTSPHIAKVVNSMIGYRAQNKYEIKYLPRGARDTGVAEARTAVVKFLWDATQAEYVIADATTPQYVGPLGWVKVAFQFDDPTREPITIENVPWTEMAWDPKAKRLDLYDARFLTRERWTLLDEARLLHPAFAAQLEQFVQTGGDQQSKVSNEWGMDVTEQRAGDAVGPISSWGVQQYVYSSRKEVRLVEIQYRQLESVTYIALPDGRNVEFNPTDVGHHLLALQGAQTKQGKVNRVYFATFCGDILLEHGKSPYSHGMFEYEPFWGLVDEKGHPYGIVRLIKDEQRVINWTTSKLLWIAAARQAFADDDADIEDLQENLSRPDGIIKRRAPGSVEIIPQGDMASLNESLLQNALNNIKEIAGSTDEMRGQQSNADSGKAILARQDAAVRQQGRFLDNEQRALTRIGMRLGTMIDQVYTDERVLRITEADGKTQHVAINVQDPLRRHELEQQGLKVYGPINQGEYDCVVATSPLSTTLRQEESEQLTQMMGSLDPQVRLALLDVWVQSKQLSNGDELVKRIQQVQQQVMAPPQQPPPDPISANYKDLPPLAQHQWLIREGLIPAGTPFDPAGMVPVETQAKHMQAADLAAAQHQQAQAATEQQRQAQQMQQAAQQQHEAMMAQMQHGQKMQQSDQQHQQAMQQQAMAAAMQPEPQEQGE